MSKICFASFEIHPTVSGGAGVLLANAARVLLEEGHEVIFLLDLPAEDFRRFDEADRPALPHPERCRAYQVDALTAGLPYAYEDFPSLFEFNSYRFHAAASQVCRLEQPDVIEFTDYCGVAYHALCAKAAGLDYPRTHLAVRLHNSLELIDAEQPGEVHTFDRYCLYNLERHALRLAETVLYPSRSFLEDAYRPHYEPWFGSAVLSAPPLVDKPAPSGEFSTPDAILFYGRLVGAKGVDRFIDAAILYLSEPSNPPRQFYLVGYDSKLPPGSKGLYADYLRRKIPARFQEHFHFTGRLTWPELGRLLPRVLFAVIPSYSESFCYAAHELYEAGVPLIVSNIPAFEDAFQHEKNALVFDGSVAGLARQMQRLSTDAALRARITRPYPVLPPPLGEFYTAAGRESWVVPPGGEEPLPLLVCILCHQPEHLGETLASLEQAGGGKVRVILAQPAPEGESGGVVSWFLGRKTTFTDAAGSPLIPTQLQTESALLILQAGDVLSPGYLQTALATLARQKQIAFVGCWKRTSGGRRPPGGQFAAFDASPELLPFKLGSNLSRFVLRTPPGRLLIDLFDPRDAELGEIAYLWKLDSPSACGLVIPEPLVTLREAEQNLLDSNALDFLILRDSSPYRQKRLARYLLTLKDRASALSRSRRIQRGDPYERMPAWLKNAIFWLGASGLNRWFNRKAPRVKQTLRRALEALRGASDS